MGVEDKGPRGENEAYSDGIFQPSFNIDKCSLNEGICGFELFILFLIRVVKDIIRNCQKRLNRSIISILK